MPQPADLQSAIKSLAAAETISNAAEARRIFLDFRARLTRGEIRAAEKVANPQGESRWTVNPWVKQGILLGFRLGEMQEMSDGDVLTFVDKDTFPARRLTLADRVRLVPGGSSRSRLNCSAPNSPKCEESTSGKHAACMGECPKR